MAKHRKKSGKVTLQLKYELYGILILIFSVITLSKEGSVARSLSYLFRFFIGVFDWVVPVVFIYIGLFVMIRRAWPRGWTARRWGSVLVLSGFLLMSHISMFQQMYPNGDLPAEPSIIIGQTWSSLVRGLSPTDQGAELLSNQVGGGMIGAIMYAGLYFLFGNLGARLIEYSLFAIGFILITGMSYVDLIGKSKKLFKGSGKFFRDLAEQAVQLSRGPRKPKPVRTRKAAQPPVPAFDDFEDEEFESPILTPPREKRKPIFFQLLQKKQAKAPDSGEDPFDDTEQVLYRGDEDDSSEQDSFAEEHEKPGTAAPLIRDFQDHIVEQRIAEAPEIEPVQDEEVPWQEPQQEQQKSKPRPSNQMNIKLPVEPAEDGADMVFNDASAVNDKPYELPPLSLLEKPSGSGKGGDQADYKAIARKLEATLESFGVKTKVLEVVRGPAVTRYEIQPDVGVKVSRVVSLTDDIALALAAKDIRMEAPIPGKSAIGIEVPNPEVAVVTLREVMESSIFQEAGSKLSIAFGRDISGQPIVGNLAKMPHLLVAGATGSGKSVCINGIITSILYKAKPNEVKFLMIDPKMVELNMYNGIPHLLAPVVTDPRRASLALKKIVAEMEKRYELFSKYGTRNIEGYNSMLEAKHIEGEPLPYIVVILDELADLMMVAAHDVEDSICRLAQKARACGIHLLIATQRPSVDVLTGLIKANIPTRIAFSVSSQVDSRTILDVNGAERLLGRGDMLFLENGSAKPVRLQGCFISDEEIERVAAHVKEKQGPSYLFDPDDFRQTASMGGEDDELFEEACRFVIAQGGASTSSLQRHFRIGYNRAARLIEMMEERGLISEARGSKPRDVLMSEDEWERWREQNS